MTDFEPIRGLPNNVSSGPAQPASQGEFTPLNIPISVDKKGNTVVGNVPEGVSEKLGKLADRAMEITKEAVEVWEKVPYAYLINGGIWGSIGMIVATELFLIGGKVFDAPQAYDVITRLMGGGAGLLSGAVAMSGIGKMVGEGIVSPAYDKLRDAVKKINIDLP